MLVSADALAGDQAVRSTQAREQMQALAKIAKRPLGVSIGEIARQFNFSHTAQIRYRNQCIEDIELHF